jgi:maleate isomerase
MEREVPAMLRGSAGEPLSFHSSRMAMRQVSAEELKNMDAQAVRCASELTDARCDVMAYACLVAVMVQGPGAHRRVQQRLTDVVRDHGSNAPVLSSAGALVDTVHRLGAKRVAMVTPYMPALADTVVAYLEAEGIAVASVRSLGGYRQL